MKCRDVKDYELYLIIILYMILDFPLKPEPCVCLNPEP